MKIDCEGCEYELILSTDEGTLARFDEIILEYHAGYLNLINKLRNCGFICKKVTPGYIGHGIVHAKRKEDDDLPKD